MELARLFAPLAFPAVDCLDIKAARVEQHHM